ncbi:MAG: hypothetical protein R3A10_12065 [Caldilineaceae bacterium]
MPVGTTRDRGTGLALRGHPALPSTAIHGYVPEDALADILGKGAW